MFHDLIPGTSLFVERAKERKKRKSAGHVTQAKAEREEGHRRNPSRARKNF